MTTTETWLSAGWVSVDYPNRAVGVYTARRKADGLTAVYSWRAAVSGGHACTAEIRGKDGQRATLYSDATMWEDLQEDIDGLHPPPARAAAPVVTTACPPWFYGDYPGWGGVEYYGGGVRKRKRTRDGLTVTWQAHRAVGEWESFVCGDTRVGVYVANWKSICEAAEANEPPRATRTFKVLLHVGKFTGVVKGVDVVPEDVTEGDVGAFAVIPLLRGLSESVAAASIAPDGMFGWVSRLPGARQYGEHSWNIEVPHE